MRVLELELSGFMASAPTLLRFPRAGVVVVTGNNGAGKSSIVEGVAVALFGKTLRGTPWWPPALAGEKGRRRSSARVVTDLVRAERVRSGGKVSLAWSVNGDEDAGRVVLSGSMLHRGASSTGGVGLPGPVDVAVAGPTYETATQAQEALGGVIGTFDRWRRTSAFSAADASHLSGARDGERKRLLEDMLGLDRFDPALEACRDDLHAAERDFGTHRAELDRALSGAAAARARMEQAARELDRARAAVPGVSPELAEAVSGADVTEHVADARAWAREADALVAAATKAHARADLLAEQARRAVEQFRAGDCPTCGQPVGDLRADREGARVAADCDVQLTASALASARSDADEARAVVDALTRRQREAEEARQRAHLLDRARRQALLVVERVEREVADLVELVAVADADAARVTGAVDRLRARVQVFKAAEAVLGLRGFRAHVLAKSLAGVSAVAGAWLPRLGKPGLRVTLRPYTEKKGGGVVDAISFDVQGAGAGFGYDAASNGERRRVDVAVLLALAEVGQAAAGRTGSSLFFDEVFDALDPPGVAGLSDALEELARDRMVLVVSHNEDVIRGLRATMRVRVGGGTARVVHSAGVAYDLLSRLDDGGVEQDPIDADAG